jgi:hypothetical protein
VAKKLKSKSNGDDPSKKTGAATPITRWLTVLAQDPSIRRPDDDSQLLTTKVEVACENLKHGPRGHRFSVIDFDATANVLYSPAIIEQAHDPFDGVTSPKKLVGDPHFHAQNVYALCANTLLTFERALGRHVSWSFDYGTHELKLLPHAFCDQNAYYSRRDESLLLGYFTGAKGETVFTCLSRDIVVHEVTHALLDGLRPQLDRPSSPDQAAFHEGYADAVALLSVLSSEEMITHQFYDDASKDGTLLLDKALEKITEAGFLLGLAEQFGAATDELGRDALRRSAKIEAHPDAYKNASEEPHERGEIFVAPLLDAFLALWYARLERKGKDGSSLPNPRVELRRVAEEGAKAAEHLLRLSIRAIDYLPPAHLRFGDFLSAALTADHEACPDDRRYRYREKLADAFARFGIKPTSTYTEGRWEPPNCDIDYSTVRLEALRRDPEAVYRFLHDNAAEFGLVADALTKICSVRPVMRVSGDGFVLHETVAEYLQIMFVNAADLRTLKLKVPPFMDESQRVWLHGGGTLVFDETGRLKFHIRNRLNGPQQNDRLKALWANEDHRLHSAFTSSSGDGPRRFAHMHLAKLGGADGFPVDTSPETEWL